MTAGTVTLPTSFSFPYQLDQSFDILNHFMSGGTYSLISVNLGHSTNPAMEEQILAVASYGKQLGRIGDALEVLIAHFEPKQPLTKKEDDALIALRGLLLEIGEAKAGLSGKAPAG